MGSDAHSSRIDYAEDQQLVETHISRVYLGAQRVWKTKKAVNLGFLDFTTSSLRAAACARETALNRRLAPDVYLGIAPVRATERGLAFGPTLPADQASNASTLKRLCAEHPEQDWAVVMRRLKDEARADCLLAAGNLTQARIRQIAQALARFHAQAERCPAEQAQELLATLAFNVQENFRQTASEAMHYISREEEQRIESQQLSFLREQAPLLSRRVRQGRFVDGHGDLRLEHIYFTEAGLTVIDCIEFNDRFRLGDVAADLAFLVMELRHLERADLAEDLLAAYAELSGDYDLLTLSNFYEGYRAYVRAKVATILAADEQAPTAVRQEAARRARRLFLHALGAQHEDLEMPRLIAVGGLIASGKSAVSSHLSRALHCPVVDSDRTRKSLLGASAESTLPASAYAPQVTERVQKELCRRVATVLDSGRSVIVDTTFRNPALRKRVFDIARSRKVPARFLECRTSAQEAMRRLKQRQDSRSVSDARAEHYEEMARGWTDVETAEGISHAVVNTEAPQAAVQQRLAELLELASDKPIAP